MRRGDEVFVAQVLDGAVVVESAHIAAPVPRGGRWLELDRKLSGTPWPRVEDVSRSRGEALLRLVKKLESDEYHARKVAADFASKAERIAALAAEARKQADAAKPPKKKGGAR